LKDASCFPAIGAHFSRSSNERKSECTFYFPSKLNLSTRIQWTNPSLERTTNTNKQPTLLLPLRILHSLLNNITHKRSAQQNRRLIQIVMLITQRPHSSSFEDQARVVRDILANPAARERSQEVAVGDDQHVERLVHATLGLANGVLVEALADVGDDGVAAGGDVGGGSVGQSLVFDGFPLLLPGFGIREF
jgi:hypothetical protein